MKLNKNLFFNALLLILSLVILIYFKLFSSNDSVSNGWIIVIFKFLFILTISFQLFSSIFVFKRFKSLGTSLLRSVLELLISPITVVLSFTFFKIFTRASEDDLLVLLFITIILFLIFFILFLSLQLLRFLNKSKKEGILNTFKRIFSANTLFKKRVYFILLVYLFLIILLFIHSWLYPYHFALEGFISHNLTFLIYFVSFAVFIASIIYVLKGYNFFITLPLIDLVFQILMRGLPLYKEGLIIHRGDGFVFVSLLLFILSLIINFIILFVKYFLNKVKFPQK